MHRGYLSLGSNVGDRLANLQAAVDSVDDRSTLTDTRVSPKLCVTASSSIYETEPVGEVLDQRDFYNMCVAIETSLTPEELLNRCKQSERELGRSAGVQRHGPRPIDIDILLLGNQPYQSSQLELPHAELTNRRFVLVPLLEIDHEIVVPGKDIEAAAYLSQIDDQVVTRVSAPLTLIDANAESQAHAAHN